MLSIIFINASVFLVVQCLSYVRPFVPTTEWQTVLDGQVLPQGLHIRIDFTTGVKEAKLMGGMTGESIDIQDSALVPVAKTMLDKRIRSDPIVLLKEALQVLNESDSIEDNLIAVENIEMFSKLDFAKDFVTLGGTYSIRLMLARFQGNMNFDTILRQTCLSIGALAQNNAFVSEAFVKSNIMELLMGYFENGPLKSLMFAISCIVRSSRMAHERFEDLKGVELLLDLVEGDSDSNVKRRALAIVADDVMNVGDGYTAFSYEDAWCHAIVTFDGDLIARDDLVAVMEYFDRIRLCQE